MCDRPSERRAEPTLPWARHLSPRQPFRAHLQPRPHRDRAPGRARVTAAKIHIPLEGALMLETISGEPVPLSRPLGAAGSEQQVFYSGYLFHVFPEADACEILSLAAAAGTHRVCRAPAVSSAGTVHGCREPARDGRHASATPGLGNGPGSPHTASTGQRGTQEPHRERTNLIFKGNKLQLNNNYEQTAERGESLRCV